MNRRAVLAAATLLFASTAIVGCSTATVPDATPTPTVTASATSTALPPVSLGTTCTLLFGTDMNGPVNKTVDIIGRFADSPDLSTVTASELSDVIADLETAKATATSDLAPYIQAQVTPLRELLDAKRGTSAGGTVELGEYKTASLELVTRCGAYI